MKDELAWYFNFPCSELKEKTFERKVLSSIFLISFPHQNKEIGSFILWGQGAGFLIHKIRMEFSNLILTLHLFGLMCSYEYAEFGVWMTPFSLTSPPFFSLPSLSFYQKKTPRANLSYQHSSPSEYILKALLAQVVTSLGQIPEFYIFMD